MAEFNTLQQSQEANTHNTILNSMPVLHYRGIKKFEYDAEKELLTADGDAIRRCTKIMIFARGGYRNETIIQLELELTEGVYSYVGLIAEEASIRIK